MEMTREKDINIRFIEFMPFDGNVWNSKKLVSFAEMKEIIVCYMTPYYTLSYACSILS